MIDLNRISTEAMEDHQRVLPRILDEHIKETGSAWAYKIRNEFDFIVRNSYCKTKTYNLQSLFETTQTDPQ